MRVYQMQVRDKEWERREGWWVRMKVCRSNGTNRRRENRRVEHVVRVCCNGTCIDDGIGKTKD